jgi:aspartate aminotransferase
VFLSLIIRFIKHEKKGLKNMTELTKKNYISETASTVEASITMAITALANQLKSEGKPVIGMSAGEPDFDTPEFIKEAGIDAIRAGKTKYTAAAGLPVLKESIAKRLKADHGLDYDASQIVVSCGAKHSIFNVLLATLNSGDEVIIPSPYWVSYPDQVKMLGGVPVFIETTDADNFKITAQQLEASITKKSKIVILNTPSNPTGMVYTKSELQSLAEVIVKHQLLVISDEIYEKLIYDGEHVSIASLGEDIKDLTILINGASKAYSMTGWRIGYAAMPKEIAGACGRLQSHSTSNPTSISQWASLAAFEGDDSAVMEMKKEFVKRKKYMVERLNSISGITCLDPQGAFYAFPNISALIGKKSASGTIEDSVSFCTLFLQDKLVACVPGSGFGAEGYLRLSYATSMDAIVSALDRLEEWVGELK